MTQRAARVRLVAPAFGGGLLLASALLACASAPPPAAVAPTPVAPSAEAPPVAAPSGASSTPVASSASSPKTEARKAPRCEGPAPTYAADVRPVLARKCFSCHSGDGPAAEDHDFSREDVLRAQRSSVVDEVSTRSMPPPTRPQLTDAEADVLLRYATCAPRG
jgi:hypothetical protein